MDDEKKEDKWEGEKWRNVDTLVIYGEKLSPIMDLEERASMLSKSYISLFYYFIPPFYYYKNVFLISFFSTNTMPITHTYTHTSKKKSSYVD